MKLMKMEIIYLQLFRVDYSKKTRVIELNDEEEEEEESDEEEYEE